MSATRTPIAPPRAQRRPVLVAVVGLIVAMFGVVVGSGTASAHTSFESSTPANGAVLAEPVDEGDDRAGLGGENTPSAGDELMG